MSKVNKRHTVIVPHLLNLENINIKESRQKPLTEQQYIENVSLSKFVTRKLVGKEVSQKNPRRYTADCNAENHRQSGHQRSSLTEQQCVDLFREKVVLDLKDNIMTDKPQSPHNVMVDRRQAGSNWNAARSSDKTNQNSATDKPNDETPTLNSKLEKNKDNSPAEDVLQLEGCVQQKPLSKAARLRQRRKANQLNRYVAMDCEMVGTGTGGMFDVLARVSIVNKNGEVLLDKYVKPTEPVTDYRTHVSGIRPINIENGEDFNVIQDEVIHLLQGKILVGHSIHNDLTVLKIRHPHANIRDTARYKQLNRIVSHGRTPSLKHLSQAILGWSIQNGEHDSVEDARATMKIYNTIGKEWEKHIQSQRHHHYN